MRPVSTAAPSSKAWLYLSRVLLCVALLAVAGIPGTRGMRPSAPPAPPEENGPVLPLDRGARAAVHVLDASSHQPIANADVRAIFVTDDGSADAGTHATGADGVARFDELPRGAHWIVADADGHARGGTYVALGLEEERDITIELGAEHRIEVRVHDESGAPIDRAEVEVAAGGPIPVGALTDATGVAKIAHLAAGPWVVTARAKEREETTRTGVPEGAPVDIVLRALGALAVKVVDSSGAPAGKARVEITGAALGATRTRAAETTEAGTVRIAALPTGSYALRAVKGSLVAPTELDVRVSGGKDADATLRLEQGASVAVHVIVEERAGDLPVPGAAVVLAEGGVSPFPLEGVTDRDGRVRLGPITRTPSALSVSARDYVGRGGISVPDPGAGEVRVVLPRAATLEGRVVDARGFPIGGGTLVVVGTDRTGGPIDEDPRKNQFREALFAAALPGPTPLVQRGELGVVPGPVPAIPRAGTVLTPGVAPPGFRMNDAPPTEPWTTRGDGTFKLGAVPPGRVRVLARHPQYVEAASEMVPLEPGGKAEVTIVMREGALLEGVVVDAKTDRAEPNVRVTALASRGFLERSARTGDDGRFAFASLPEVVTLVAEASGGRTTRLVVELKDGEKKSVKLALGEARDPVLVTVKDDRDYPVDGVQLSVGSLDPKTPLRATAFTDARGEARINGARGLPLRITASRPGHAITSIALDESASQRPVAIVLARGSSAFGVIRGRRAGLLEGAEVLAFVDGNVIRSRTDAKGEFRLDGLPGTEVRLVVRAKGHAPFERTMEIQASRNDRGTDLGRIELPDECAVEGDVVDESGAPIAGARIAKDHVPTWVPATNLPSGMAVADARGHFHLGELSEGTIALEAYMADVGRGRIEGVRASPGRPTTGLRIVLARDGSAKAAEPHATGNVAITLATTEEGALFIASVVESSAAERAGLASGDVITEIDGAPVSAIADARAKLAGPVQEDVVIALRRGDKALTLRVPREAARR